MKAEIKECGSKGRKRILLVDQFSISRSTAYKWVEESPDLQVCGEAATDATALTAVEHLKPDAVVTEILGSEDRDFIRSLHKLHPRLRILVYSFGNEERYAPIALEAGADGYLMKGAGHVALVDGIRLLVKGRLVLSPRVRGRLLSKCLRKPRFFRRIKNWHLCSSIGINHES